MTILRKILMARPAAPVAGLAIALAAACAAAPAAAADNVYWSIGVAPAPGVTVIAGNAPPPRVVTPVYVGPSVYAYPPVVYAPPRVVYTPPPVYVQPAPVVVLPPGQWDRPHRHHGWGRGHGHGHEGYYRY